MAKERSVPFISVLERGFAFAVFEDADEMADVWGSAGNGNFIDGLAGILQEFFGMVDPSGDDVFSDRTAGVAAELAGKVEFADAVCSGQVVKGDFVPETAVQFFHNGFYMFGGSEGFAALFLCGQDQVGEDCVDMVGDLYIRAIVLPGDQSDDGLHITDQPAAGIRIDVSQDRKRRIGESLMEFVAAGAVKVKPYKFPFAVFPAFVIVVLHARNPEDVSLLQKIFGSVIKKPSVTRQGDDDQIAVQVPAFGKIGGSGFKVSRFLNI